MLNPSTSTLSNYVKLNIVSKVYHDLYNYSPGKKTMSKYQCTYGFTRKVCALLYYVNTTTYNQINFNHPHVLVRFHTRRRFSASLSIRVSDSCHPVTYAIKFCTNIPGHKIYLWMSVCSTRHNVILHTSTIIYTKTFFAPTCHPRKIYCCMTAHFTKHHRLLHNPTIVHTKTFFAPACHPHQKISSTP